MGSPGIGLHAPGLAGDGVKTNLSPMCARTPVIMPKMPGPARHSRLRVADSSVGRDLRAASPAAIWCCGSPRSTASICRRQWGWNSTSMRRRVSESIRPRVAALGQWRERRRCGPHRRRRRPELDLGDRAPRGLPPARGADRGGAATGARGARRRVDRDRNGGPHGSPRDRRHARLGNDDAGVPFERRPAACAGHATLTRAPDGRGGRPGGAARAGAVRPLLDDRARLPAARVAGERSASGRVGRDPARPRYREGLRTALRGGWLGHPGARARRRAEARAAEAIAAARAWPADADELDLALDRWALHVLTERAASTLAAGTHARRAFAGAPLGSLLVPFDGTADVALLVDEAHRVDISTLLVQHGFDSRLGVPDKERADVIALWSERDRGSVPPGARGRVVVTGNPGAEHLAGAHGGRAPRCNRTLVLVDYASRMSSLITERVASATCLRRSRASPTLGRGARS